MDNNKISEEYVYKLLNICRLIINNDGKFEDKKVVDKLNSEIRDIYINLPKNSIENIAKDIADEIYREMLFKKEELYKISSEKKMNEDIIKRKINNMALFIINDYNNVMGNQTANNQ